MEAPLAGLVDEIGKVAVAAEVTGLGLEDALEVTVAEFGAVVEEVLEVMNACEKAVGVVDIPLGDA